MSGVILHIRILCLTVNSHHSYVLFVYCFTLVLSQSVVILFLCVLCVLCLAAGIDEINFLLVD